MIALFASAFPASGQTNMKLFLLMGQSNMAGRGNVEAQDLVTHPRVYKLTKQQTWVLSVDPVHFDKSAAGTGLASRFARLYADANPGVTVGLIPCAYGGTNLDEWQPGAGPISGESVSLYNTTLARARKAMESGTIVGILWHQGEADSSSAKVATYPDRFATMIGKLREDLEIPNVPVIAGELGRFYGGSSNYNPMLPTLLRRVPLSGHATSENLTANPDNLHFNSASLRTYGARYHSVYSDVTKWLSYEMENRTPVVSAGSFENITDNQCGNGRWTKFNATAPGQHLEATIYSVPAGSYSVSVRYKRFNDRGTFRFSLDGTNLGPVVDQYKSTSDVWETTLGDVTFQSQSNHTVRFTVTGKNAASSSHALSIDAIILKPIPAPPASSGIWTATGTATALNWSTGAHWSGGVPPQSDSSTAITYFPGGTLPAGTITSHNDIASPFSLNSLTLAGSGPQTIVRIAGSTLRFAASGDGNAPLADFSSTAGGPAYHLEAPVSLSATTSFQGVGGATLAIPGNITGSGGLTKTGGGMLILSGSNSHAGSTTMGTGTNGVLRVTNASGLGNGALWVNTGAVTPLVQLHIDGPGDNGTITMPNGFGGNSNISTTIDVGSNGGGNTGNTILLDGATTAWGNNVTLNVTGSDGYGLAIARIRSTGGSSGTQTFNPSTAPLTLGTHLGADNATTLALGGTHEGNSITGAIVNGNSTVSIVKSNTGTWLLEGNNTYTGATTISGGALVIASNTALGSTTGATTISSGGRGRLVLRGGITVAEPVSVNGRNSGEHLVNESGVNTLTGPLSLNTGGNDYYIRSDDGRLVFGNAVTMVNSSASKTLHISGDGDMEISGTIGNGGGTLGIGKTGPGTLILSGTQNHNGATVINGGIVIVNGDLTATSGVTVASGAKLSGHGSIAAATVVNGTHAPGFGTGSQTFAASLAYTATSRLEWELAENSISTGFDSVSAETVAIADGAVIDIVLDAPGSGVNFTDGFWLQTRSWTVLSANSIGGSFTLGTVSGDSASHTAENHGSFSLQQTGSFLHVVWTPDSPFLAWREHFFGEDANDPGIAGDTADPDHDGIPNLVEYAFGTSPVDSNASGISTSREDGYFSMIYTLLKSATGITVQPLWSTGLLDWSDEGIILETRSDDGTFRTIEARIPAGTNGGIFMKLRVTRP